LIDRRATRLAEILYQWCQKAPFAACLHVRERGFAERWTGRATTFAVEDLFLDFGEEDFGLLSVASFKASIDGDSKVRASRIPLAGIRPPGELEHASPPSFKNIGKFSRLRNHRRASLNPAPVSLNRARMERSGTWFWNRAKRSASESRFVSMKNAMSCYKLNRNALKIRFSPAVNTK